MRGARRVLLIVIVLILAGVGASYVIQRDRQARQAPLPPPGLPPNVDATSTDWVHTEYDQGRPVLEIRAKVMRQIRMPSEFELEGVELRIFDDSGKTYDRVQSGLATFDVEAESLYSEGDVEITLKAPIEGPAPDDLVVIRTSGVRFDTLSGRATTDRPTSFRFGQAEGRSVGATYDPSWGDLRMHRGVLLRWRSEDPARDAMQVEAGELSYKEDQSVVYLSPWSRFTRGPLTLEAADSAITLEEGAIRLVNAEKAHGEIAHPGKDIHYEAEHLVLDFTPDGAMSKIVGERGARMLSKASGSETEVESDRIFMDFLTEGNDSELASVLAWGEARLESRPAAGAGGKAFTKRILRSEIIKAVMRDGGKEIEQIETPEPGTIELIPAGPEQKRRRLDGSRLLIQYAANNQLRTVRADQAATRTENGSAANPAPPTLTWSDVLVADFAPESGELQGLQQWGNFRYQEGERQATAERAEMDLARARTVLSGKARLWNPEGSTAADEILINQREDVVTAAGNVSSTRAPEGRSGGGLLAGNEAIHATAGKMTSTADGAYIVYEDKAVLWQGANRIQAPRVEINREHKSLTAAGGVVSRFVDEAAGAGRFTTIRAKEMVYLDEHRSAHYSGDVELARPGLRLDSRELRMFLEQDGAGPASSLHHMLADGAVKIVKRLPGRTQTGFAEHAEYYVGEEKIILDGGGPRLVDSLRGTTQGRRLTYFARDDRLLVDGGESRPAVTRLRRQ